MKVSVSSIVIAVAYVLLGGAFALITPRFGAMLAELYSSEAPLPGVTALVLSPGALGWLVFGVLGAGLVVGKDLLPETRKIPNWLFAALLVLLTACVVLGLFLPLIVTIERLGQ